MNKLLIALALIPTLATAGSVKGSREISAMIAQAPMAQVVCDRFDYAKNCHQFVIDRIYDEMVRSGFDKSEAEACSITSLTANDGLELKCARAFGLEKEYKGEVTK
ncbi:hypothetical protein KIT04_024 [Vibrio phage KIT04]|nr:hypothetical protein KIT04_024 [Vibrio phage KIT04]